MKYLFITLNVQDGENRHTHRVLHTCDDNENVQEAADTYASDYYGIGERDEFSNFYFFNSGTIAVEVTSVRELTEYEYQIMSDIFSNTIPQKNYFEIVRAGLYKNMDREEIQVHCGENGNLFIFKTDEGFVVDMYNQNDHVNSMTIWEEDLDVK